MLKNVSRLALISNGIGIFLACALLILVNLLSDWERPFNPLGDGPFLYLIFGFVIALILGAFLRSLPLVAGSLLILLGIGQIIIGFISYLNGIGIGVGLLWLITGGGAVLVSRTEKPEPFSLQAIPRRIPKIFLIGLMIFVLFFGCSLVLYRPHVGAIFTPVKSLVTPTK